MTNPLKIFCIKRGERGLALVALLVFFALNALLVGIHWKAYTDGASGGFWTIFSTRYNVSGYDCTSWYVISEGRIIFRSIRHPLYYTFLYPMYLLNSWLMKVIDVNFAVIFVGIIIIFSAVYTVIFVYRILHELLGLRRLDALLLVALLFSFGHVLLATMVPEHFAISMMLLTMTAYIVGKCMQQGRMLKSWQSMILLFFTSGIATSNGLKTIVAGWFCNGRKAFRPKFFLLGVVLPLIALMAIRQYQYKVYEVPQKKKYETIAKANEKKNGLTQQQIDAQAKWIAQNGPKHFRPSGLLYMMDFATPRIPTIIENFLGESMMLHKDYALKDTLKDRPMIVHYRSWFPYALVAVVTLIFFAGIWVGRRQKLLQMLLCWLGIDIMLNLTLGFAINEVYIMASGWMFVIPVAFGYLLKSLPSKMVYPWRSVVFAITITLWIHNGQIIINHFL